MFDTPFTSSHTRRPPSWGSIDGLVDPGAWNFSGEPIPSVWRYLDALRGGRTEWRTSAFGIGDLNHLQGRLDCRMWRAEGLMPLVKEEWVYRAASSYTSHRCLPMLLVWKHVRFSGVDTVLYPLSDGLSFRPTIVRESLVSWVGNMYAPYQVRRPYLWPGMVTAGPMGAIRDWSGSMSGAPGVGSQIAEKYVMAIAGIVSDYKPEQGVYYALFGIPMAVYQVTWGVQHEPDHTFYPIAPVAPGEVLLKLVDGQDVLPMIEEGKCR